MNGELRELIALEDYLNRLLRRVQRRIIASGGMIPDDGNICGLSKAEALAEIEEESGQSVTPTTAELEEVNWLNEHVGQVHAAQARALAIPQCLSSTTSNTKKRPNRGNHEVA